MTSNQHNFSLNDKYLKEEGNILLSGIQALVRLPMEQHRADQRRGLKTATLISGYRGSPLGGLDFALQRSQALLAQHNVTFIPAVNEDLGATAVWGSQMANALPQPIYDGVLGMWYGKGPGVDRSGDALKHANFSGVGRNGGVLVLAGDDPAAKSSTIPSHSEPALYDAQMPVLYPGNAQEILDLGRWGFELSRYTGCWVGFKVTTDVADEFSSVKVSPGQIQVIDPGFVYNGQPWQHSQNTTIIAPYSIAMERELHEGRLEAAKLFAVTHRLNTISVSSSDDWIGIIAAGKTYYDVRAALMQLGLNEAALNRYGIRLLKIAMPYPLEPSIVRRFAQGLDEILVFEEKRSFVELFVRDVLYNQAERPRVIGKRDQEERLLVRGDGELDADDVAAVLAKRLTQRIASESLHIAHQETAPGLAPTPTAVRTPYFCSGCPHNRSTVVPEDSLVGAGIG